MINISLKEQGAKDSLKLTKGILEILKIKNIAREFEAGKILKSTADGRICDIDEEDAKIISRLEPNFIIYHVMYNNYSFTDMEFKSSSNINTIETRSYLCVAKNLFDDLFSNSEEDYSIDEYTQSMIEEVEYNLNNSKEGRVHAYVVNPEAGFGEFGKIGVKKRGDGLIRLY